MEKTVDEKRHMKFAHIYDAMMGYTQKPTIKNEFEAGECGKLYDKSFEIRVSISKQLDGNPNGENKEVIELIELYEKMQKILCKKCYQYGYADGLKASPKNH